MSKADDKDFLAYLDRLEQMVEKQGCKEWIEKYKREHPDAEPR